VPGGTHHSRRGEACLARCVLAGARSTAPVRLSCRQPRWRASSHDLVCAERAWLLHRPTGGTRPAPANTVRHPVAGRPTPARVLSVVGAVRERPGDGGQRTVVVPDGASSERVAFPVETGLRRGSAWRPGRSRTAPTRRNRCTGIRPWRMAGLRPTRRYPGALEKEEGALRPPPGLVRG
jgi:hypothetical protein